MGVLMGQSIQLPEVNAKPQGSVFLVNQYHSITLGTVAGTDGSSIEY